jgi:hypothetical protein
MRALLVWFCQNEPNLRGRPSHQFAGFNLFAEPAPVLALGERLSSAISPTSIQSATGCSRATIAEIAKRLKDAA